MIYSTTLRIIEASSENTVRAEASVVDRIQEMEWKWCSSPEQVVMDEEWLIAAHEANETTWASDCAPQQQHCLIMTAGW